MKKKVDKSAPKRKLVHEYDFEQRAPMSQKYVDSVMPDHVKKALSKKKAAKPS